MNFAIDTLVAKLLFILFVLAAVFQNILSMFLADSGPLVSLGILAMKDLMLYVIIGLWFLFIFSRWKIDVLSGLSVVLVISLFFYSVSVRDVNVMSFRQLLIIPLSVVMGRVLYVSGIGFNFLFKTIIFSSFFVMITGYVELLFLYDASEAFWNAAGVEKWMIIKGFDKWSDPDLNVSLSYYSYDLYYLLGERIRRMASILGEPTIFGQLMPLPAFYFYLKRNYLLSFMFVLAIALSLSKGGLFVLFAAVAIKYYYSSTNAAKIAVAISSIFIIVTISYLFLYLYPVQSIINHVSGAKDSLIVMLSNPFGLGVGVSGNYYNLSTQYSDMMPGESYFGLIVAQFGLVGFLLIVLYLFKVTPLRQLPYLDRERSSVLLIVAATWFAAIFSESAITYTGSVMLISVSTFVAYQIKSKRVV